MSTDSTGASAALAVLRPPPFNNASATRPTTKHAARRPALEAKERTLPGNKGHALVSPVRLVRCKRAVFQVSSSPSRTALRPPVHVCSRVSCNPEENLEENPNAFWRDFALRRKLKKRKKARKKTLHENKINVVMFFVYFMFCFQARIEYS